MHNKTLVLGVGNPILRDDGVGIHIVRELRKSLVNVDIIEATVSGLELVECLQGYERVLIVDAVKTEGGVPGMLYQLDVDDILPLHGASPHDMDFRTAVEFGRKFMPHFPGEVTIYGVEVGEVTEFGETLTPQVQKSVPEVVESIRRYVLTEWTSEQN
jgi:hydrogenase maturation protease